MKTVSFETAKKLKDAGFKQETYFYHSLNDKGIYHVCSHREFELLKKISKGEPLPAPDTDELLEGLPYFIEGEDVYVYAFQIHCGSVSDKRDWIPNYYDELTGNSVYDFSHRNESLIESLAELWLKLKEKKLVQMQDKLFSSGAKYIEIKVVHNGLNSTEIERIRTVMTSPEAKTLKIMLEVKLSKKKND